VDSFGCSIFTLSLIIVVVTGNLIISAAIFLMDVFIVDYFLFQEIQKFKQVKEEAYMRELESFRLRLTPEERKRFDEVYKILFHLQDERRKEEE